MTQARQALIDAIKSIEVAARDPKQLEPPLEDVVCVLGQVALDIHDTSQAMERIAAVLERIAVKQL